MARAGARTRDPTVHVVNLPYGSQITTTRRGRVVHHAHAGQPPPLRGAARLHRRRADLPAGRRPVRLHPLGDDQPGARVAGRTLELFAPARKPGPPLGVAPAKDRARGRVIQLRRQGLSTYEISARLAAEHTPLNRTSVAEILAEEG